MFSITKKYNQKSNVLIINFEGDFTDKHQSQFNEFIDLYELDHLEFYPLRKQKIKPKNQRVCRFCGQCMPTVTFNNEAHTIPQLLGNKTMVSEFECDECNHELGRYDDDLAKFLGASRTITHLKGQKGIPKFKNPDETLIIEKDESKANEKSLKIESHGLDNDHFELNEKENILTIKAVKQPYRPINVFKSILKIALCYIQEDDVKYYKSAINFLKTNNSSSQFKGNPLIRLFIYQIAGTPFPSPLIFLWKKKEEYSKERFPTRTFIFYFHHYIFQIFLPFDDNDKWMYHRGEKVTFRIMAPFIDKSWINIFGNPTFANLDLSDNHFKRNEPQRLSLKFVTHDFFPNKSDV